MDVPIELLVPDPKVPPARLRLWLRQCGVPPGPACPPGPALYVWAAALVAARSPLDETGQTILLDCVRARLVAEGARVAAEAAGGGGVLAAFLVVSDWTFASVAAGDRVEHWDLRTGDPVGSYPPPVEAVTYNLAELYRVHARRVADRLAAARNRKEAADARPDRPGAAAGP